MKILRPINSNASENTKELLRYLQLLSASEYAVCGAFNFINKKEDGCYDMHPKS